MMQLVLLWQVSFTDPVAFYHLNNTLNTLYSVNICVLSGHRYSCDCSFHSRISLREIPRGSDKTCATKMSLVCLSLFMS